MARLFRGDSGEPIIVIGGDSSSTYNSFGKKTSTEKQSAVVVDVLSEGPIKGLVDGASSVQLNGVPILDPITKQSYSAAVSSNVSYTASSRTITDNNSTLFANRGTADGTYKIQIEGGLKSASGLISTTAGLSTVTASSSFFAADQVSFNSESRTLTIPGAGAGGSDYKGRIVQFINATSVSVEPAPSVSVSGANASIDLVGTISTISNNTATLVGSGTLGINKANVKANLSTPGVSASTTPDRWNFEDAGFAFRSGTRDQSVLALPGNVGTNSLTTNAGVTLNTTDFNAITHNGSPIFPEDYVTANGVSNWSRISEPDAGRLVYTSDGMGVPSPGEVDAIKVTIKFPNGLLGQKPGDGAEEAGFAEFQILFEYSVTGNFDDTKTYVAYGHSDAQLQSRAALPGRSADSFGGKAGTHSTTGTIKKKTKTAFVQTFSWSVTALQPFTKYRIKISKITPTNGFNERRYWYNATQLQSIQNIITDKTSYPYTAYAATIFGAKDFSSPPRRGFEIRGLQVKVPTNYFSRHELGEGSQPSYTRKVTNNITTTNETEYQDWDGNFRGDIKTFTNPNHSNYATVWTDNPVWILLDILTNDRYGLGKFVDPLDDFSYVDKFQLFQIAKYCDELVPDGKGGLEPRFTANLYLSKMEEAQKVVNDLLSIFRGLLIWFDGKFTPTINAYKSPVYTFTKGNVVGGEFNYQSTSTRFRSNQVRVTWNNPEDNYKQDVEVVEDTQNILESSKIISKDVTATGCTSQGQAHRFGKWHLLTEKLEKEIVSFSTGLNAIALRPGDVVEIQDADLSETEHSGRVSNTGTRSTTVIPLDRNISLNTSTKAYKLNLIFPKGGAYLSQEKATINSTDYVLGDLVLLDESGASIDTQEKASNVKDDSDNLVQLFWSDSVRVESKPVGTFTTNSVTVTSAFSETPDAEVIWSLSSTLISTGQEEENITPKEYIIINTEEKEKNIIVLSAVEYSKEKFELVDRGYVTEIVSEHQKPPLKSDIVPQVESLTASVSTSSIETSNTTATNGRADLLISWQPPVQVRQSTESTISGAVNNSTSVTLSSSNTIIDVGMRVRHSSISGVVTVSAIDGTALTLSSAVTLSSGVELSFKHDVPDENIIGYNVKVVGPKTNDMADWETRGNAYFKFVTAEDTTTSLKGIVEGTYYVHIKAVNIIQNLSAPSTVRINYTAQKYSVPTGQNKLLGIDKGGVLDKALTINSGSGNAIIASNTYSFTHSNGTVFHNTSSNANTYQQSFSGIGSSSVGYLLYDHGSSDTLKAVQIYEDDTATDIDGNKLNIEYWKEVGAANNGLTTKTGTVSITDNSATLTGSSTAFTTEFDEGDFIVLGSGSTAFYAYINFIESDTIMDLDRVPTRNYSGTTIKKLSYVPNYAEDQIIAKIATDGSTTYSIEDTYAITAGLDGAASAAGEDARSVKLTASSFVVRYNTSDTVTSNNITFTTDGQGTGSNAQTFRFLTKESGESSFTQRQGFSHTPNNDEFTLADSEEPAIGGETQIKVEMNEAGSSSNPVASDTVTVYAIQDGAASAAGDDAVTAFLTNAAHVISTNSAGNNASYTTAGGLFDVFVGADRRTLHNDVDFFAGATGTSTSLTQNGLTLTFNNTDGSSAKGTYTLSGSSWSTDSESFTVRAVLASSVPGISSAVTITRIYSISKSKTGVDGATGNEVAEVRIYYKQTYSNSIPNTPSGGTYNFDTKVFTPPSGWSITLPATNFLEIVYSSVATVTGASTETSVSPGTFSAPSIQIGVTPTTNYIFKRSANQPTKPSPADYQTVPSGWEDDIADVPSGSDPIWSSFGKAAWNSSNRTFITTWQEAVQQEGSTGAPGQDGDEGAGVINVYKRKSTLPSTPSAGTANPPTSDGTVWYSTIAAAKSASTGILWVLIGNRPAGSTTITWNNPVRHIEDYGNLGGTKPPEDANKFTVPTNSTDGIFSFDIDGTTDTYEVFGDISRTRFGRLRAGTDPIDGTNSIRNQSIDVSFTSNTLSLTGIGGTNTASLTKGTLGLSYDDGATVGAVAGTNLKQNNGTVLSDVDIRNSDLDIDTNGTDIRIKKGTTLINSTTLNKTNVGLSDLNSLETGAGTKLGGIATGATVGAVAGTNLKQNNGTVLSDVDIRNSDLDIDTNGTDIRIKKGTTLINSTTLNKTNVGLSDLASLDSTSSGKLGGIAANATVGAVLGSNLKAADGSTTLGDNDVKNTALDVDIDGTAIKLKIGNTPTSTVTATQGLVGLSGVANNADVTSANTANNVSNVGDQSVANAQQAVIAANLGFTTSGVVKKIVPKEQGGLNEDISNKTGVLDFSSGTANFRATLPTNRGGFGLNVASLFGSTVGRLPRWNGSAFVSVAENDFKNSSVDQTFIANAITNTSGFRSSIGAGTSDFSGLVQDLGGTTLDAAQVPIDDSNFFKVDSGEIKFGDTINYTGHITAGSGTKKAGLVGSGTDADSTIRIFAGQSFANRTAAPFRVTQGGEVNVTSFNVNTGTSSTNLRFRPGDASGYFFSVGNSADPSSAPMRARSVSGSSHIELQNVKIFKSDGSTLMFDSEEGFTSAAYTDIASNVGTSDTGSSVSTATITNLINPFTLTGGANSIATTPSSQQKRFTKVTLTSSKVLTFKVIKDGSMDGLALGSGANAAAKAKIPTNVKMRLMHSTNSNLSSANTLAVLGTSFSAGVSRTELTPSATQYQISRTVNDGTPGFEIVEWDTLNTSSDALAASGNFEITDSDTYGSGDHYFFIEIDGTGGEGPGSGANDISLYAARTLEVSGSGDFSVDSSGNIQPAGSTRVSANSTFTDNRLIIADGNSRGVESSSGLTYSSSILDVTGAIRATGDVTAFHSSDERLKDNITVIDSALAKVKELRGVEFDWNDKQSLHKGHDIGVIAQDVEQVAPELVKDREDGYKAVDYPKLTALLIEAVKELELKVKQLEDKQK